MQIVSPNFASGSSNWPACRLSNCRSHRRQSRASHDLYQSTLLSLNPQRWWKLLLCPRLRQEPRRSWISRFRRLSSTSIRCQPVEETAPQVAQLPPAPQAAQAPVPSLTPMPMRAEEVDLSDEWEAMAQEVIETPPVTEQEVEQAVAEQAIEQAEETLAAETRVEQAEEARAAETRAEQAPPSEEAVPAEVPAAVEASAPVEPEDLEIESEPKDRDHRRRIGASARRGAAG